MFPIGPFELVVIAGIVIVVFAAPVALVVWLFPRKRRDD
jgi:Sec-independent protein translocase protein TatA